MDRKSFMRGFGAGILFATIILGISCLIRTSDSSIIKRAKELGMDYVQEEETLFSKKEAATKGAITSSDKKEEKKQEKETQSPAPTPKKEEKSDKDVQDPKKEFENEKEKVQEELDAISKELTIREGDWSSDVSENLEKLGIISDAADFDSYLEEHGYSDEIRAGTFDIPSDADYDEIARRITS